MSRLVWFRFADPDGTILSESQVLLLMTEDGNTDLFSANLCCDFPVRCPEACRIWIYASGFALLAGQRLKAGASLRGLGLTRDRPVLVVVYRPLTASHYLAMEGR